MARSNLKVIADNVTNGGKEAIEYEIPYVANVTIQGSSDMLFHRWNCESIIEKSKVGKNSKAKKVDDVESYVWRDEAGNICLPGEYFRQSIVNAAKFKQDPRSPRKSARDLFNASLVSLTNLASLGTKNWDYLDTRRAPVQRQGINRTRPAMKVGWKADMELQVLTPEYISPELLYETMAMAGRLIGVGDFRPTFGRFNIVSFKTTEA